MTTSLIIYGPAPTEAQMKALLVRYGLQHVLMNWMPKKKLPKTGYIVHTLARPASLSPKDPRVVAVESVLK